MRIKPFAALRPLPERVMAVAAVPYDVVDSSEARALAAGNPDSFLRISRPEIDLDPAVDIHSAEVYAQAARNFSEFQQRGILVREEREAIYLYRQIMGAHSQTGVVACSHIDDYAQELIRKHEKTRQDKEDDRTNHCLALRANSGPVFLTYRDSAALDALVAAAQGGAPLYDFTSEDGIRHTLWRVEGESAPWVEAFAAVPLSYVADGHHRAAAAYRSGEKLRQANPAHTGSEEYNWFLTVLFPESQLKVLPYNRCVADLHGLDHAAFLKQVGESFAVERLGDTPGAAEPQGSCEVRMYLDGSWYRLAWEPFEGDPVAVLDVSVLQDRLLAPILGIDDPRTSERIAFIGGIRGAAELVKRVDSGIDAVAFSLYPVSVAQVMAIADAGRIMPPKSTWFEPKLRSGLLVHTL